MPNINPESPFPHWCKDRQSRGKWHFYPMIKADIALLIDLIDYRE